MPPQLNMIGTTLQKFFNKKCRNDRPDDSICPTGFPLEWVHLLASLGVWFYR